MELRTIKQMETVFLIALVAWIIGLVLGRPSWLVAYGTAMLGIGILIKLFIRRREVRNQR